MTGKLNNHLAALAELRNLAIKKGQYGAAVSAEIARGKAAGFYTEKTETTIMGIRSGVLRVPAAMTEDEWQAKANKFKEAEI